MERLKFSKHRQVAAISFAVSLACLFAILATVNLLGVRSAVALVLLSAAGAAIFAAVMVLLTRKSYTKLLQFRNSVSQLSSLFKYFPGGIVIFDKHARLTAVNSRYGAMYGLAADQVHVGMHEKELQALRRKHGLPLPGDTTALNKIFGNGQSEYSVEFWSMSSGQTIRVSHLPVEGGGWIATHEDVSKEFEQQKALEHAQGFLENVIDNVPSAILVKDVASLKYTMVNHAAEAIHNLSKTDIMGRTSFEFFPEAQAKRIEARDLLAITGEDSGRQREDVLDLPEFGRRTIASRRHVVHNSAGEPTHLLTVLDDITVQREAEDRVRHMAMHDPLTDLLNRSWINENLQNIVAGLENDEELTLALLDLDGFKGVNDTFGHAAGDALLRNVASRTQILLSDFDRFVRLGGDEFAILAIRKIGDKSIQPMLQDILKSIGKFVEYEGHRLAVHASAGYSKTADPAFDSGRLLREADIALYEAKEHGKDKVCRFDPAMMAKRMKRKTMELDLRRAIGTDQFELYYQPIVNTQTGDIKSMEALLRWNHPSQGMVRPDDFIPLAEEIGLIIPIGEMVLEEACRTAVTWPEHVRVSVNISPVQFRDLNLGSKIASIIARSGIRPSRLELEITEATLLTNDLSSHKILNDLRATGVRVVMDDFGTGYSSLNYIRNFPFDKIKIDKSYVDGLVGGADNSDRILHAVITLAKELNLDTTAEGVELAEQIAILKEEGCTELQGYFFSRPVPASQVAGLFAGQLPRLSMVA